MSDHDDLDEELGAALRRRAGAGTGSIDNAHHAVLARASHVRRRRAAVAGGSAMAVMIVGGFILLPRDSGDTLAPADRPERSSTTVGSSRVPTFSSDDSGDGSSIDATVAQVAESGTVTSSTGPLSMRPTTTATTTNTSPSSVPTQIKPGGSAPRTSVVPGTALATTSPQNTTASTASSSSVPATSSSPSTTSEPSDPPPAPFTSNYNSVYGSITVSWNGSSLALGAVSPVSGATAEIEIQEALRVRVRFYGDGESRIEIRINGSDVIENIS